MKHISLGIIISILGLVIIFYPNIKKGENQKRQKQIIEKIEQKIEKNEHKDVKQYLNKDLIDININEDMIKIDKINLKLPILEGATKENLSIAPCRMVETSKIGEVGNCAIAGHRSYTDGRQFNRLDEINTGDKIEIISKGKLYIYTVTKKFIVKPEDVWVLEKNNDTDKMITLITCTPIKVATHRLIIQGVIKEN